jgi:predicted transcriptional regulator YdeE
MKVFHLYTVFALFFFACNKQAPNTKTNSMNKQVIQEFKIIGITTRTTNKDGQAAIDIEALWEKFWGEKIQEKIPNKINDDIYAVYTGYESDYTGAYTTIIGSAVSSFENIPEGFTGITIEETSYQRFVSKGKMPEAVVKTWMEIWGNEELNKRRSYKADFTVHGEKYYLGDQAEVETFIAVRK